MKKYWILLVTMMFVWPMTVQAQVVLDDDEDEEEVVEEVEDDDEDDEEVTEDELMVIDDEGNEELIDFPEAMTYDPGRRLPHGSRESHLRPRGLH